VSWHRHVRRAGRHLGRLLLLCLLVLVLVVGALLAVLGSETGSRWVLEQGLGMQQTLGARYERGTWLDGLELADVRIQTQKTEVRIRHLLARWSLWQLLRGGLQLERLQLEGVDIYKLTPPTAEPTQLPTLLLPLHLFVQDAEVRDLRYWRYRNETPLTLRRLALAGDWRGARVRLQRLHAEQERIGVLDLAGEVRLRGGYPLEATGLLDYSPFREQGWQPVSVALAGSLEDLELKLQSQGGLTAKGQGRIRPLEPELPFDAFLEWQEVALPWWSDQIWRSQGGHLKAQGSRLRLEVQGEAQLSGRQLPSGRYALKGRTEDWKSAAINYLNFNGLGGKAKVSGEVDWKGGLAWRLESRLEGLVPGQKWQLTELVPAVLTGQLKSTGRTNSDGSKVEVSLELAGGERWVLSQQGASWPWRLEARQQLSARWSGVQRRLGDGRVLQSESGELSAEGSRRDYRAQAALQLGGPGLPAGQWSLELQGVERQVDVSRLAYAGEAGRLDFHGHLALGRPLQWQGELALQDFATAWLQPDWPGRFSGRLAGSGSWAPGRREFLLEETHLEGMLRDAPLTLDGPLELALVPGAWPELRSPALNARWGANRVVLMGGLRKGHWDLSAQLDLGNLALLHKDLAGALRGQLGLQGAERRPDIQASLTGSQLGLRGWTTAAAVLEARLQRLGDEPGRITLSAEAVTSPQERNWGGLGLELTGSRTQHVLDWRAQGETGSGQGRLSGSWQPGVWSGRMESGAISLADMSWQLAAPFALDWRRSGHRLRLDAHCWTSAEARLCNEDEMRLGAAGHVRLGLAGLQLQQLAGLMPEGLRLEGAVTGRVAGDWEEGRTPAVTGFLEAVKGRVHLLREDAEGVLTLGYQRVAVEAEADPRRVDLRFELRSPDMGQGQAQARIDPHLAGKPLQGELALEGVRLEVLQPFFPALSALAGTLSASGRLGGVLARPDFHGRVKLRDGELGFQRLPLHINDINARLDVQGSVADIRGSMRGGEGTATLEGRADWSGEPRLDLALQGRRFQLRQPPEILAEVDPDLRLHVAARRADLTGTVRVPMARLNLKPLTDRAVPLSPDIRVVSAADRERAQVVGRVEDWSINADIRLLLGDDVWFHGYGVNGRLLGGLRLRQEGRRGLEANGEVELDREARYDAYGQRLQIRRGRLIFAGNLTQPGLDVEAIREVDDKVVGVRVQGRANAPEATLFSDQSMSQEEIVSYLVLGRPLDSTGRPQAGDGGNLAAAAAAIKLGATGGAGITSRVGETIGITDFTVDAEGSGDDTQFTVSGYLSPRLYLRYGVGIFTPVNTASLRYKINSRLYLEAVSSLESAIDLFYNWRF
jgi:translocation and assembly module TamB